MSQVGTAANQTSALTSLEQALTQLKTWAVAEVQAIENGVVQFVDKIEPVLEQDVVSAITAFGQACVKEAIALLSGGATTNETASQVTTSLIQKIEADGKTIAVNTAQTAAQQITSTAATILGGAVATAAGA